MALVYRAHFALISRPILTSKGVNTSALYGFTQTLLDILKKQQPTHLAVAFDTQAPTARHAEFPDYKATREAMPEDLSLALPHVCRMLEAFKVPVLTCDGYEADDIIGTLVQRAEKEGFQSWMVTPDKDFGQLITENIFLYKPSRMGDGVEILGVPEILNRWGIKSPDQVVDVLALMGDTSDNIPGVPGIGEKTAIKLIAQHGSVENLLAHTSELKGRVKETLETNRDKALLSKRLVTIIRDAPCPIDLESLKVQPADDAKLKELFVEFEFNSIGRRLFGEDFKGGRGFQPPRASGAGVSPATSAGVSPALLAPGTPGPAGRRDARPTTEELQLTSETEVGAGTSSSPQDRVTPDPEGSVPYVVPFTAPSEQPSPSANLKTIADIPHEYRVAATPAERADLLRKLEKNATFSFALDTAGTEARETRILGVAFSFKPHTGYYVPMPDEPTESKRLLEEFRPLFESAQIEKEGHNLKFDLSVLKWHGISVRGKLFDTMIAHSLIEPEMRHGLNYMSEVFLGYSALPSLPEGRGAGGEGSIPSSPRPSPLDSLSSVVLPDLRSASGEGGLTKEDRPSETSDLHLQLRAALEPLLKEKGQERVFYEIESPLISVLVDMEHEGIKVDAAALADFAIQLSKEIDTLEKTICRMAGTTFNLNSPKQLGQILFDVMKICPAPKKTKTGQYTTDEQTLAALAPDHEIVRLLLEHRTASKLKSTYAEALPAAIWPATGRIHTTYNQVATTTGRLNSQNPNLQNIPIRSERGQEIRKAFIPRDIHYRLLSADYSQIELRIIAALSREPGLLEAFRTGVDVHTATAAKVYGVFLEMVTPEMRRKAKMVNYGIAYGISAFGLSQRLGIPRKEAAGIIEQYFTQFPGIRKYMDDTMAFGRERGYVETVTGRRRYIRDINSSNNTVRSSAERNAINAPIQGSAADMIKVAMINIHRELTQRKLKTRMLLQVHD